MRTHRFEFFPPPPSRKKDGFVIRVHKGRARAAWAVPQGSGEPSEHQAAGEGLLREGVPG